MTAGRRGVLLSLGFLALAVLLIRVSPVQAQPDRPHELWSSSMTPAQIKAALANLGQGGELDTNPFQQQIERLLKDKKHSPEDIQKALKLLKDNPQLLEMAKKMAKQRQVDPGRQGKLTQDDLGNLVKIGPNGVKPGPGVPPVAGQGPDGGLTKFDPSIGMGDPKIDSKGDPGLPRVNPDPMPGMPPDPANPPPMGPGGPKSPPTVDENPFPDREDGDSRTKSLQAFAAIWERNIGPLDETPEVKRALFDLVGGNGLDFDLKDGNGNSIWDLINKGDGSGIGDFLNGVESGNLQLPRFEFPKMGWGGGGGFGGFGGSGSWFGGGNASTPRPPRPSSSSSGGGSGLGGFSFSGSWTPVILLGVVIFGLLLWFWLKNVRFGTPSREVLVRDGLGPWPVDPRHIETREDVVKAFEYLSVLICGPSARTWTHSTIADALSELATTHGETAVMLARLYELARYAPLDEPLTREELIEARQLVCGLAGVSY